MLKPLNNYVLILPDPIEAPIGNTGMEDPEVIADTPVSGTIIEDLDPKYLEWEGEIKKISSLPTNTKVWFKMWAGEDIKYKDGKTYKLVRRKDFMAYEDGIENS